MENTKHLNSINKFNFQNDIPAYVQSSGEAVFQHVKCFNIFGVFSVGKLMLCRHVLVSQLRLLSNQWNTLTNKCKKCSWTPSHRMQSPFLFIEQSPSNQFGSKLWNCTILICLLLTQWKRRVWVLFKDNFSCEFVQYRKIIWLGST